MRFSKSTSRGLMKTGCVCESTKPGQNDLSRAIDLGNVLAILLQPGIAQRVFGRAHGNDLSAETQHRAVFDDAEFFEVGTAARSRPVGSTTQRDQLADVNEQQRVRCLYLVFRLGLHVYRLV
jgi:hypothetical protein